MQKQRNFNDTNAELIMFSPYIKKIFISEKKILMQHVDTQKYIWLSFNDSYVLKELISKICKGIPLFELKNYLLSIGIKDADEWISTCIKEGVLE